MIELSSKEQKALQSSSSIADCITLRDLCVRLITEIKELGSAQRSLVLHMRLLSDRLEAIRAFVSADDHYLDEGERHD